MQSCVISECHEWFSKSIKKNIIAENLVKIAETSNNELLIEKIYAVVISYHCNEFLALLKIHAGRNRNLIINLA